MTLVGYTVNRRGDVCAVVCQPDSPWLQVVHPSKLKGLHSWEDPDCSMEFWGKSMEEAKAFASQHYDYNGPVCIRWYNE